MVRVVLASLSPAVDALETQVKIDASWWHALLSHVLLLSLLGFASADPRLHGAIAVVALLTNILGFGVVLYQPWQAG